MRYALLSCKQKQAKVQQNHEYKLRKNASIYSCHRSLERLILLHEKSVDSSITLNLEKSNSGTLSLREFHERYWSPDFKIGRSFRGCHFNCRCVHSLAM
uniref:Uncharacterized protein n=1 Tax=Oryza barthii TaxID=65489 RepID=A0A0D3HCT7_9ORYZ